VRDSAEGIKFKVAVRLCCLPLAALPLGLLAFGGPCASPHNIAGCAILFVIGLVTVVTPAYGVIRILQSFQANLVGAKVLGAVSILCACFAVLVGGFYLFIGIDSLRAFI
jgi:hypothetical protein